MKTKLLILLTLTLAIHAYAGSATWNLNPATNDWNTAANWMPNTIPNGPSDVATFATSRQTEVDLSSSVEVDAITFQAGASQFSITVPTELALTISGAGIINESAVAQNFVTTGGISSRDNGSITLSNSATAGISTVITNNAHVNVLQSGGRTTFRDRSSASSASIVNNGPVVTSGFAGGPFSVIAPQRRPRRL